VPSQQPPVQVAAVQVVLPPHTPAVQTLPGLAGSQSTPASTQLPLVPQQPEVQVFPEQQVCPLPPQVPFTHCPAVQMAPPLAGPQLVASA
jgi:hypothetical protein